MSIQLFILTRFNLLLWLRDKKGTKVRSREWLEHRFSLFEDYCFPSVKNQSCQDFIWIILFDSMTPDVFKKRIAAYQTDCPHLVPIYVEPENGRHFASVFRAEVMKRVDQRCTRVVTTYLDNDDALNINFIEDVQLRSEELADGTIINYNDGYQFFERGQYIMKLRHKKNHFMSVVERASSLKTIYGYGSHYYIDGREDVKTIHVQDRPMWCEIVHEKNMDNDAYFLRAKLARDRELLKRDFAIDAEVQTGLDKYLFCYLPRYVRVFFRRLKYFFLGRHW